MIEGFQTLTASRASTALLNEKHAGKKILNSDGEAEKTADERQRQDLLFYLKGRHASMPSQLAMVDAVPRGHGTSDLIHV